MNLKAHAQRINNLWLVVLLVRLEKFFNKEG